MVTDAEMEILSNLMTSQSIELMNKDRQIRTLTLSRDALMAAIEEQSDSVYLMNRADEIMTEMAKEDGLLGRLE